MAFPRRCGAGASMPHRAMPRCWILRCWTSQLTPKPTRRLADARRLTVYDAAYLELAARRAAPLASLDDDVRMAAERLSVTLLGKWHRPESD
jgi:hypothetical protein